MGGFSRKYMHKTSETRQADSLIQFNDHLGIPFFIRQNVCHQGDMGGFSQNTDTRLPKLGKHMAHGTLQSNALVGIRFLIRHIVSQ